MHAHEAVIRYPIAMEADPEMQHTHKSLLLLFSDRALLAMMMRWQSGKWELALHKGQDFLREDQRERHARQKTCMQEITTALSRRSNISPKPADIHYQLQN